MPSDIITKDFCQANLNVQEMAVLNILQNEFSELAQMVTDMLPISRERTIIYAKMQEACMWVGKTISRQGVLT